MLVGLLFGLGLEAGQDPTSWFLPQSDSTKSDEAFNHPPARSPKMSASQPLAKEGVLLNPWDFALPAALDLQSTAAACL